MRAWVILLVAACSSSSAQPAPPPPAKNPVVLATIAAWDVRPIAGKLLVVDDKFLTVSAFDASTGKRAWSTQVIKEARGRHTLESSGVLAWFGETLSSLDPATGKLRALGKRGYNGVEWSQGGCHIDIADGVCAQRCQCSFQLFDCATNKDIGKRYEKSYMEFHESDASGGRSSSAGCWGMGDQLLGKAKSTALITVEDGTRGRGKSRGPEVTLGIDVATGKEAWRLAQQSQFGDHSPDGKTCWFYGFTEALVAVDCASGKQLWTGTKLPAMGRHGVEFIPATAKTKAGIFDLRAPTNAPAVASLHDERTGAARWTVKLPANTLAWVRGTNLDLATGTYDATSVAILDPATGKTIATIALPTNSGIVPDGRGGFLVPANPVVQYDANGKETGRAGVGDPALFLGDSLVVAKLDAELVVLDRGTLRERGRVFGAFTVVHVEGPLGANRIAAYAYDGKTIGAVTLLRVQ